MKNVYERKVEDILRDNFLIPFYQRDYSWERNDIEDFIDFFLDNESKSFPQLFHFKKIEKIKKNEIIDGQQRLTTLGIISLVILRKLLSDIKPNNEDLTANEESIFKICFSDTSIINEIKTEKMINKIKGLPLRFEKSLEQSIFQDLSYKEFLNSFKKGDIFTQDDVLNTFKYNFYIIETILNNLKKEEYNNFLRKYRRTEIIIREESGDSSKLFEKLNSTGKNLTTLESTKAKLLGNTIDLSQLSLINNIIKNTKELKWDFNGLLTTFLINKYYKETKGQFKSWESSRRVLMNQLDQIIKIKSKEEILKELDKYIDIVNRLQNGDIKINNKYYKELGLLDKTIHHFVTYLYTSRDIENKEILKDNEEIIKVINKFIYRGSIIDIENRFLSFFNYNGIEPFYGFQDKYKEKNMKEKYIYYFGKLGLMPSNEKIDKFKDNLEYNKWSAVKKCLACLNTNVLDKTIEHIIPQSYYKNSKDFDKYNKILNNKMKDFSELESSGSHLGNLLLLNRSENSSLGNKSPFEKKEEYEHRGLNVTKDMLIHLEKNDLSYENIKKRGKQIFEDLKNNKELYEFDYDKYDEIEKEYNLTKDENNKIIEECKNSIVFNTQEVIKIITNLIKEENKKGNNEDIDSKKISKIIEKKYDKEKEQYKKLIDIKEIEEIIKNKIQKQMTYKQVYIPVIRFLNKEGYKLELNVVKMMEIEKKENIDIVKNNNIIKNTKNSLKIIK